MYPSSFGNYTNTPSADQSTSLRALTNNDLQIGVGTADNTGSKVNFAAANMKHVNGLAKIVLGTRIIPLTRTFYITGINQSSSFSATTGGTTYDSKGIAAYMQYYQGQMASDPITSSSAYKTGTFTDVDGNSHHFVEDSGSRSVKAAANFEGTAHRPYYHSAQSAYYVILKPSTTSVFYSKDGIANGWGNRFTSNRINANVAANTYGSYTAYSDSTFIFFRAAFSCAGANPHEGHYESIYLPTGINKVKLEVYGASNGNYNSGGGYSYGFWPVTQKTLYVTCGGRGRTNLNNVSYTVEAAGYNGGGKGQAGGGGATHIALRLINNESVLKDYVNSKNDILIVAGGAGGPDDFVGGSGGGLQGGDGTGADAKGGTQTAGGAGYNNGQFGLGGDAANAVDSSGAGGGGWYGGGSSTWTTDGAGGGGSGHLNEILQSPHGMENNKNFKSGWAFITIE